MLGRWIKRGFTVSLDFLTFRRWELVQKQNEEEKQEKKRQDALKAGVVASTHKDKLRAQGVSEKEAELFAERGPKAVDIGEKLNAPTSPAEIKNDPNIQVLIENGLSRDVVDGSGAGSGLPGLPGGLGGGKDVKVINWEKESQLPGDYQLDHDLKQSEVTCNQNLMKSYGLRGLAKAEMMHLSLCPRVQVSCCTQQDQILFYRSYKLGGQARRIKHRYQKMNYIYGGVINALQKVNSAAVVLRYRLRKQQASNCGLLADKLVAYNIEGLAQKIFENIKRMEQFFKTSYSGFYCSLCDGENHKFINAKRSEVVFSAKFCHGLVSHSLPVLLLFHVEIQKYLKLVAKFLISCNHAGRYHVGRRIPKFLQFDVDERMEESLNDCKRDRNHRNWFTACKPVCQNFKLTEFTAAFQPNLDVMLKHTKFIHRKLIGFNTETEILPNAFAGVKTPKAKAQPGAAKPGAAPVAAPRALQLSLPSADQIFETLIGSVLDLVKFKTVFDHSGMNPHKHGTLETGDDELYAKELERQILAKDDRSIELTTRDKLAAGAPLKILSALLLFIIAAF